MIEINSIIKIDNKDEQFYNYMGKMFGSRIVQRQTNDRIYDDNGKEWYLYIEDERVVSFVSVSNNMIKNVYTIKDAYLVQILQTIRKEKKIKESIVPNLYKKLYEKAGFKINPMNTLKNFVMIYDA